MMVFEIWNSLIKIVTRLSVNFILNYYENKVLNQGLGYILIILNKYRNVLKGAFYEM